MFQFLNKVVGAFHNKPTVSYLQPKTLNIYFKGAVKSNHILLNINHYDICELEITHENKDNTNHFILVANLKGEREDRLELATFDSRKEAEEALLTLKNKLFGLDKKIVKFTSMILVLVILFGLITDFGASTLRKIFIGNQPVQTNAGYTLPPNANPTELQALQNQLLANNEAAKQRTNTVPVPTEMQQTVPVQTANPPAPEQQPSTTTEVSGNPDVNNLVNSLGK